MNEKHEAAQFDDKYLPGIFNRAMRYWFYLNRGVDVLNTFRNLLLGIFAAYFALKLENPWWLVAMFVPSTIALLVFGYMQTHYISKVTEWLGMRFGSHYGLRNYNLQEENVRLLTEIRDALKNRI